MWRKIGRLWRVVAAVAMVASMVTALMPALATATNSNSLQVNIVTPVKDAQIPLKGYFWVNATVAKPVGVASAHGVSANITWDGNVRLVEGDQVQNDEDLTGCAPATDFWWEFQCVGYGDVTFTVTGNATDVNGGSATVTVHQPPEPCPAVLEVTIIEYPQGPVSPSNDFAIKALVTNVSALPVDNVTGVIELDPEEGASLVNCAQEWDLDTIQPGCSKEVGWTLHCEEGGDLDIEVDAYAPDVDDCAILEDDVTVHQLLPAAMSVTLIAPEDVCAQCDPNFTVTANISETNGDNGIAMVMATLQITSGNAVLNSVGATQGPFCVAPGGYILVPWPVRCTGLGEVDFQVDVTGEDAVKPTIVLQASDTAATEQKDLTIEVVCPAENTSYDVGAKYDVVYTLRNCMAASAENISVGIELPPNVALSDNTVFVDCASPGVPEEIEAVLVSTNPDTGVKTYEADLGCLCSCCVANITWKVKCVGSGVVNCKPKADTIEAFAEINDQVIDEEVLHVFQINRAHLDAGIEVFEGAGATFEGDDKIEGIAVGDNFTVAIPVVNLGESAAKNVVVTLCTSGNVQMLTPQSTNQTIASIPCHGAAKLLWTFQCIGEGDVCIKVCGITGTDAVSTTALATPADVELPCQLTIKQVPVTVEIIQPLTGTNFTVGETFTVKARITNNSTLGVDLNAATAELYWTGKMALADGQGNPVDLNDLLAGETAEATWQVKCTGSGDVTFYVEVEAEEPYMEVESASETIHQQIPGELTAEILSPEFIYTYCEGICDPFSPSFIATSQDFAVTAKVCNNGGFPITITSANLTSENISKPVKGATILTGPTPGLPIIIAPKQSIVFNWTLHCTASGLTAIVANFVGEDTLCLKHVACAATAVQQYPAAHLETSIISAPTSVGVGDDFTITANITNTGEADAWDAVAILSVEPEGSVHLSPSDPVGSYVKKIGGLVGHGQKGTATVSWVLQCLEALPSTITVSAAGYDEFGYHTKQRWSYDCDHWVLDLEKEPGKAIEARNIEPASVTVEQVVDEGAEPSSGCITIALEQGWNLFSPPFFVASCNQSPAVYFASISANITKVWSYCPSTCAWKYWAPGDNASTLTAITDGNGYWLNMKGATTFVVCGDTMPAPPEPPPSYDVCVGWNLIGIRSATPVKASEWLTTIAGKYGIIYGFDNGHYFSVGANDDLVPGMGYWIAITQPGTIRH